MTPVGPQPAFALYARVIRDLGFPIVVALMLLYLIGAGVPGDISHVRREIDALNEMMLQHMRINEEQIDRIVVAEQMMTKQLGRIMQQICVNTAPAAADRSACFPVD